MMRPARLTCFRTIVICSSFAAAGALGVTACQPDLDSLSASYDQALGGAGSHSGGAHTGGSKTGGSKNSGGTGSGGSNSGGTGSGGSDSGGSTSGGSNSGGTGGSEPDSCTDGKRNADESDVDCGGTSDCHRCDVNEVCTANSDCSNDFCKNNRCTKPACDDNAQNGNETDEDCGGSCVPAKRCLDGQGCELAKDCESGFCNEGVCDSHCASTIKDGDETDVNCGGAECGKCDAGLACNGPSDCKTGICTDNICRAPSCDDALKNQNEPTVDCGGVCSSDLNNTAAADPLVLKRCALDADCNVGNDCDSLVCTSNKCVADATYDPTDLIDDLEDTNPTIKAVENRAGTWYQFNDGTGAQASGAELIPGTRGSKSSYAWHTTGSGFTNWGSGVGLDFHNEGGNKYAYDASAYVGITFWARSATAGKGLKVLFPDVNSVKSTAIGNGCQTYPGPSGPVNNCDKHLYDSVTLDSSWQKFTIMFDDLDHEGTPTALLTDQMVSIQFRPASTLGSFDFWIDDVVFIPAP